MAKPHRPWESVIDKQPSGCWLWRGTVLNTGYGQLSINGKRVYAHRVAWERINGPIPSGLLVCHKCDVRNCVNPAHLFLGTYKDNTQDAIVKGRIIRIGEGNGRAKLSAVQVDEIRQRRKSGESMYRLGKAFGIHRAHIRRICNRVAWRVA